MPVTRPSLTLTLLQAREAAMSFFRPLLNQHGLTEQQWRVIRILRQHGEMESYRLAELACILKPSMTGVLSRLERDGLVRRKKSTQDQRRVFVTLTEQGQQVHDRIVPIALDLEQELTSVLSQEELSSFKEMMTRLENRMVQRFGSDFSGDAHI